MSQVFLGSETVQFSTFILAHVAALTSGPELWWHHTVRVRDSGFSYWLFTHLYIPWIRLVVSFVSDYVWNTSGTLINMQWRMLLFYLCPMGSDHSLITFYPRCILCYHNLRCLGISDKTCWHFFCVKLILCMQLQLRNIKWNRKAMFTPQPLYNQQANSMQKIYHVLFCPLPYTK